MIESTLGSLLTLMGIVFIATQFLKSFIPIKTGFLALIIGELATLAFWQGGQITLEGVSKDGGWSSWAMAMVYALFAVAIASKSYETGDKTIQHVKKKMA